MKYYNFLSIGNYIDWLQWQHCLLNAGVKCFGFFPVFLRCPSNYMWEPRQGPPWEEAKARCMFFLYTSYSCMVTPITPGINWTPTVVSSSSLFSVAQEPPTCSCLWGGQRVSWHDVAHVLAAVDHQLQGTTWKSCISCWGQTSYHPAMSKVQGRIAKFGSISTTAIKKNIFFSSVSLMLL